MTPDHKVKVGVVQATPALFDAEKTTDIIISWIERGAREQCELLLFPEAFIPCYPRGLRFDAVVGRRTDLSRAQWLDFWSNSVEMDSPLLTRIGEAVRKAGLFVGLGVVEREPVGGSLYCTLLYFDPTGKLIGKHRKLKPTGLERYLWAEGDGSTMVSFDTKIGKIGGLICWENYMPLARMAMYNQGVELYLAPTADTRELWQSTLRHIALEGRCYVLGANQFVRKSDYPARYQDELADEPAIMSSGGSVIIGPTGDVLAGPLWNEEGLLTATLDFADLYKTKLDFDLVGHYARHDVFRLEVAGQPAIQKV
jgi:nitrilase